MCPSFAMSSLSPSKPLKGINSSYKQCFLFKTFDWVILVGVTNIRVCKTVYLCHPCKPDTVTCYLAYGNRSSLLLNHCMPHSPHEASICDKWSGQIIPKTTRTQDNSYPRQFVPRTTRTQDNSYPGQLVPMWYDIISYMIRYHTIRYHIISYMNVIFILISQPGNMYTLNWEPFRCRTIYSFYPFLYDDKNNITTYEISWDNISIPNYYLSM